VDASGGSEADVRRKIELARSCVKALDRVFWRSSISLSIKSSGVHKPTNHQFLYEFNNAAFGLFGTLLELHPRRNQLPVSFHQPGTYHSADDVTLIFHILTTLTLHHTYTISFQAQTHLFHHSLPAPTWNAFSDYT